MTVREVFEIAMQMETDGAEFYTKAAENASNESLKESLKTLSDWEKEHYKKFSRMLNEILDDSDAIVSPDGQASLYLEAFVSGALFDQNANPLEHLSADTSLEDIFKVAVSLEKDSVCYYSGIKAAVAGEAAKDKVDRIISEEMEHIRILSGHLQALNG